MGVGCGRGSAPLLNARQIQIGDLVLREIRMRLKVLLDCGARLPPSLDRPGDDPLRWRGPAQFAWHPVGAGLTGVLYVLDEPKHRPATARTTTRLLATLFKLRGPWANT